jgi:hypothetical protein
VGGGKGVDNAASPAVLFWLAAGGPGAFFGGRAAIGDFDVDGAGLDGVVQAQGEGGQGMLDCVGHEFRDNKESLV